MGYYLLDNPPAIQQFYLGRPRPLSGGVLLHTTESMMDNTGPDTGAENVAAYIARRQEYGSYHVIVDSDSTVNLLPDNAVAYHCGAGGYNGVTWGISFACRTTDLNPDGNWTKAAMANAARAIHGFWSRNGFDPVASARMIPAIETQSRPGMSTHGDAQPVDRSDAWTRHPQRAQLEALLIANIKSLSVPTPSGVDPMTNKPVMMQIGTKIWMFYEGTPFRIHIQTPADVQTYQFFGVPLKQVDAKSGEFFIRNSQEVKCG
jgi:hypothetical protein